MRRWNGWGDSQVQMHLKALPYLVEQLGEGVPFADAPLEGVVAAVPASRLAPHDLIDSAPAGRVLHAAGQSFPDWVAMRFGQYPAFPDGVAYPSSAADIAALLRYASETGARLTPYGGGTSVVGHINPLPGERPTLTVDMRRISRLQQLDDSCHKATFGAGISGPDLEAQLRARGYTLGHFPQSFEQSTLGGWVATRSSGQQSLYYGRIERLFLGGTVYTPQGVLELPAVPASAAGPDLRQLVLGSEGRLGIIAEATVQITPIPERELFYGVFFPSFEQGFRAVRQLAQERLPLSMLRLSNAHETRANLAMAGHSRLIEYMRRYLGMRGAGQDACLLIISATGARAMVNAALRRALDVARACRGISLGAPLGQQWAKNRFRGAYLRNTLWEHGYGVDTLETALSWYEVPATIDRIEEALRAALRPLGERALAFSHLSHVYPTGSSIYTTYLFRLAPTASETMRRWLALKSAASQVVVACGGTISHQHGVGLDHMPYLAAEKGTLGIGALRQILAHFDPEGLMNPGKLV
jgi:alkyldihydroxyacetonephosphate synthase